MRHQFRRTIRSETGQALSGATVTLYHAGTSNPYGLPVYLTELDAEPTGPQWTTPTGEVVFYLDHPAVLDVVVATGDRADRRFEAQIVGGDLLPVHHGADPSVPRPPVGTVKWVGTATPSNALDADLWVPENL